MTFAFATALPGASRQFRSLYMSTDSGESREPGSESHVFPSADGLSGVPAGASAAPRAVHEPVMVAEILDVLGLRPGDAVLDGTVGLGGHAVRFAAAVSPGGTVIGLDWDASMLALARERLEGYMAGAREQGQDVRVELVNDDFRNAAQHVSRLGIGLNGALLDLGLNSAQVDDQDRGISFLREGPLDMRMDRTRGEPASALLNRLGPAELERILFEYGDERWARMIAKRIVEIRKTKPLRTTTDLVEAVLLAIPPRARDKRIHPATRTFQAIRMAVNGELDGLSEAMLSIAHALLPGGVLAILSYHSGEDRIVKNTFRVLAATGGFESVIRKPVQANPSEIARNPRSRSAKLRAIRKNQSHES